MGTVMPSRSISRPGPTFETLVQAQPKPKTGHTCQACARPISIIIHQLGYSGQAESGRARLGCLNPLFPLSSLRFQLSRHWKTIDFRNNSRSPRRAICARPEPGPSQIEPSNLLLGPGVIGPGYVGLSNPLFRGFNFQCIGKQST